MTWNGIAFSAFLALLPPSWGEGGTTMPTTDTLRAPASWQMIEHAFILHEEIKNPFLTPIWVALEASTAKGESRMIPLPAFHDGDEGWKVRYTPMERGTYSVAGYRLGDDFSGAVPIDASPAGDAPAVHHIDAAPHRVFPNPCPDHLQRFRFNTGEAYFPLGHNAGWGSVGEYETMFRRMAGAGLNWSRVWMTHWSGQNLDWVIGQELEPGTLDLAAARRWDAIIAGAERHGILLQLVLQHHGQYSTWVNPNWAEHPWNVRNGGWLENASQFFTDEKARHLTKAKYRYIVARWGHSPAILAWELFNEVEFTNGYMGEELLSLWQSSGEGAGMGSGALSRLAELLDTLRGLEPATGPSNMERLVHAWTRMSANKPPLHDFGLGRREVAEWHAVMARHLRSLDPAPRMITTSSVPPDSDIWEEMDFVQIHSYQREMITPMAELPGGLAAYAKPVFVGEMGDHEIRDPEKADGRHMHGMMWAGLFSGASGAAQVWAWDQAAKVDLYRTFKSMSAFARLARLGGRVYAPVEIGHVDAPSAALEGSDPRAHALMAEDALILWIYNANTVNDPRPRSQRGHVHLPEVLQGRLAVTWWDTRSGEVLDQVIHDPQEGAPLPTPAFAGDIAAIVEPADRNHTWSIP